MGRHFAGCVNLKRIYNAPSYLDMGEDNLWRRFSYAEGLTYVSGNSNNRVDENGMKRENLQRDMW